MSAKRFRKDFGDLEEFADSLEEFGQFHEILKTKDGITIDGDRREAAFEKYLKGKSKKITKLREYRIPLTLKELEETGLYTLMQIEANSQRKSFTIEEVDNIRKHIDKIRKSGKLPERFKGIQTREITGKITQHGQRNINKIAEIIEAVNEKKLDEKYITRIDSGSTSINTVYKLATREKRSLPKSKIPKGSYDCVLIDFPIRYDNDTIRGGASDHYPTIPLEQCIEEAKKFPIADNAVIFLYITKPMKFDRPNINHPKDEVEGIHAHSTQDHLVNSLNIDSVKDEFVLVKDKFGNGNYTRSQHEYLLICFKGKTVVPAKAFSSIIDFPLREHSSKPEVWSMIKKMYPKRKYFECYRRDITPDVDGFGNQTRGVDFGGKTDKVTIVTMEKQGDKNKIIDVKQMSPIEKLRNKKK
ncbi:MAG: hypothetical protein O6761_06790 [Thaumarchaeota archaeon]|nr:hypothetical protein [Nitrososphaerota archaeon]